MPATKVQEDIPLIS